MKIGSNNDADGTEAPTTTGRPVARRLALRVNGARVGEAARPTAAAGELIGPRKAARFGLRVHSTPPELIDVAPRPALRTTVLDPADYATADDYEAK